MILTGIADDGVVARLLDHSERICSVSADLVRHIIVLNTERVGGFAVLHNIKVVRLVTCT